jgi:hypothetical protein
MGFFLFNIKTKKKKKKKKPYHLSFFQKNQLSRLLVL